MTSPPQDASIHSPWTSRVFPPHGGMLFAPGLDSPPRYPSLTDPWSPQLSPTHVNVGNSASVAEAIKKQRVLGSHCFSPSYLPGEKLDWTPHDPSRAICTIDLHKVHLSDCSVGDGASVAEAIKKQRVLGTPSSASRVQSPKKSKKVEPERFCALKNVLVLQSTMLKVQDALFGRACRFAYAHVNIQRDLRCVSNRIHAIL